MNFCCEAHLICYYLYCVCTGDQASLFTGVLFGPLYGPPVGFRFEDHYNFNPPIMVRNLTLNISNCDNGIV